MPLTETDRKLMNDLLAASPAGWAAFVDRFSGLVVHIIRHTASAHSLKLSDDDVDDLTADVFGSLQTGNATAVRSFRGRSSLAAFLAVVIRRIVLTMKTREREGKEYGIIVIAEGLAELLPFKHVEGVPRDDHGHIKISEISLYTLFAELIEAEYARQHDGKKRPVKPLLNHLHVQPPQEADAEARAEG